MPTERPTAEMWIYNGKTMVRLSSGKRSINLSLDEAAELHAVLGKAIEEFGRTKRPSRRTLETWN